MKERTGPAAVCLPGIIFHQSLILSIKAVRLSFFFLLLSPDPLHPPHSFQSDSCLGNRGKSSFSQTDVPFSWKLECVKKPTRRKSFQSSSVEMRKQGGEEQKDNGEKIGRESSFPLLRSSTRLLVGEISQCTGGWFTGKRRRCCGLLGGRLNPGIRGT